MVICEAVHVQSIKAVWQDCFLNFAFRWNDGVSIWSRFRLNNVADYFMHSFTAVMHYHDVTNIEKAKGVTFKIILRLQFWFEPNIMIGPAGLSSKVLYEVNKVTMELCTVWFETIQGWNYHCLFSLHLGNTLAQPVWPRNFQELPLRSPPVHNLFQYPCILILQLSHHLSSPKLCTCAQLGRWPQGLDMSMQMCGKQLLRLLTAFLLWDFGYPLQSILHSHFCLLKTCAHIKGFLAWTCSWEVNNPWMPLCHCGCCCPYLDHPLEVFHETLVKGHTSIKVISDVHIVTKSC